MKLRIQMFGPFQVWGNDTAIDPKAWKRRKTQSLLKVLLTAPGQVFSQDQLVEHLFHDLDPFKATQNLHARVSELRRVLEPQLRQGRESRYVVSVGKGRYRFNLNKNCWVDAVAFESLADTGLQHHAQKDWQQAAHRLGQAAQLHRGDFLSEDRFEPWAQVPLARMSELYSQTLLALADCFQRLNQSPRAIRVLHTAVDHEPVREDLVRKLMQLHHESGNPSGVAKVFAQCEQSLQQALDVSPSAETRTLYRSLLASSAWPAHPVDHTVAVLPFSTKDVEKRHRLHVRGLTEDLIGQLSKHRNLRVIAHTSVARYGESNRPLGQIASELGADTLVLGRARTDADEVSVYLSLHDVNSDREIWAQSFTRGAGDLFTLPGNLSQSVARALNPNRSSHEHAHTGGATDHMPAYHDYLKGRFLWNKRTKFALVKAIKFFDAAIKKDPTYALPHAGKADSYALLGWFGFANTNHVFPKGLQAAKAALELDPMLAEAHTSLAYLSLNHLWDWAAAKQSFADALGLNPNYALAHHWYAEYLSTLCRHSEAVDSMKNALALDPLSLTINTVLAWKLYFADALNDAEIQCQKVLELDDSFGPAHTVLGLIYEQRGHYPQAITEFETEIKKSGQHFPNLASLAYVRALAGEREAALDIVDRLKKRKCPSHYHLALIHMGLGDSESAIGHLERAVSARSWAVVYLRAVKRFKPLHNHPRFTRMIQRIGIPG